ncbi:type II toxin-antitoxin system CcdA family antitoxin [Erwinia sp. AnSW2-5]|uniref:type II toxin-antitoxin system CcdA family antitoxin n=1 Tax=Erwinia sp. AnSW2-5 TaxID=3367692 RepID=UPI00385BCE97
MQEHKRDETEPGDDALTARQRWCVENKAGLDALNKYIEQNGLFTDEDAFNVL